MLPFLKSKHIILSGQNTLFSVSVRSYGSGTAFPGVLPRWCRPNIEQQCNVAWVLQIPLNRCCCHAPTACFHTRRKAPTHGLWLAVRSSSDIQVTSTLVKVAWHLTTWKWWTEAASVAMCAEMCALPLRAFLVDRARACAVRILQIWAICLEASDKLTQRRFTCNSQT